MKQTFGHRNLKKLLRQCGVFFVDSTEKEVKKKSIRESIGLAAKENVREFNWCYYDVKVSIILFFFFRFRHTNISFLLCFSLSGGTYSDLLLAVKLIIYKWINAPIIIFPIKYLFSVKSFNAFTNEEYSIFFFWIGSRKYCLFRLVILSGEVVVLTTIPKFKLYFFCVCLFFNQYRTTFYRSFFFKEFYSFFFGQTKQDVN